MFLEDQTIEDFGKGDQPEPKTSDLIDMDPSPSSSVDDETREMCIHLLKMWRMMLILMKLS